MACCESSSTNHRGGMRQSWSRKNSSPWWVDGGTGREKREGSRVRRFRRKWKMKKEKEKEKGKGKKKLTCPFQCQRWKPDNQPWCPMKNFKNQEMKEKERKNKKMKNSNFRKIMKIKRRRKATASSSCPQSWGALRPNGEDARTEKGSLRVSFSFFLLFLPSFFPSAPWPNVVDSVCEICQTVCQAVFDHAEGHEDLSETAKRQQQQRKRKKWKRQRQSQCQPWHFVWTVECSSCHWGKQALHSSCAADGTTRRRRRKQAEREKVQERSVLPFLCPLCW